MFYRASGAARRAEAASRGAGGWLALRQNFTAIFAIDPNELVVSRALSDFIATLRTLSVHRIRLATATGVARRGWAHQHRAAHGGATT